ncbi:hypothetical protein VB735_20675 [Halotia wernerae UHCC 0503]|nr:hypothetical protein [Halotia wernerae UHCC 0503]
MADDVYSNAEIAKYKAILVIISEDRCINLSRINIRYLSQAIEIKI